MATIEKNTAISLGVVMSIATVVIGAVIWLTQVHGQVLDNTSISKKNEQKIEEMAKVQQESLQLLTKQGQQLEFIKEIVKDIKKKVDK